MANDDKKTRYQRLDDLSSLLRSGEFLTVKQLAENLFVSTRTVSRDLDFLRQQGLPIEADRGRGGGVQLHHSWGAGKVNLTAQESIDLLISLAVAEKMNSPIFMGNMAAIRRKISASFSSNIRIHLQRLRSRLFIAPPASSSVIASLSDKQLRDIGFIHRGFVEMQALEIQYRSEKEELTRRVIEPHYLLLSFPVWYILAWDRLRDDIRMFRFDRIQSIKLADEFQLHHRAEFLQQLEFHSQSI